MDIEQQLANDSTKYKIRIFAQTCYYRKKAIPEMKIEKNMFGIDTTVFNHYDEIEGNQMAVNINAAVMNEGQFQKLWENLGKAIKMELIEKGALK